MLDVNFNYFKEIYDEWSLKSKQISGKVQYAESETQFWLYLWTTEWKFRCVVNKKDISKIDTIHYVRSGKRINGRVTDMQDVAEMVEILTEVRNHLASINSREKIQEINDLAKKNRRRRR